MNFKYLLLGVAFAILAGCNAVPIRNIADAPVVTGSGKPATAEQVRGAIVSAGNGLGWTMTPTTPGLVTGHLALRGHSAIIEARYTRSTYSLLYKDSSNLGHQGDQIHKNYNSWIENLNRDIRAKLMSL